jgi:predicted small metal-binding protein
MTLELRCGDVVNGCEGVVNGGTQDEVLTAAAVHAADAHGLTKIDADTEAALIAAIHPA